MNAPAVDQAVAATTEAGDRAISAIDTIANTAAGWPPRNARRRSRRRTPMPSTATRAFPKKRSPNCVAKASCRR
jgi:hypothetical protein